MTLQGIRQSHPIVDRAKIAATRESDIRRHQAEDGEDPDVPLPRLQPTSDVRVIRTRLRMTQDVFVRATDVPVATVRNWEQARTRMDPAVRSLLRVLEREPDLMLRTLAEP